ncbi:MAG: MFS transporter [bacterium]
MLQDEEGKINTGYNKSDAAKIRAIPWFLTGGALNTIFYLWTFGGSLFLLFLNELGLPKGQIGMLLSLFPFCGVLALAFSPTATRLGRKKVFLWCYGVRKFVMALLLFLPWIISNFGHAVGLIFLFTILIIFALLRAFAETASYPWAQECIPNYVRGKVTGMSIVLGTITSGIALWIAGRVIGSSTGLSGYLLLIAIGCFAGILGVLAMFKVPGGDPQDEVIEPGTHRTNLFLALRDSNFVAFLTGIGCVNFGTTLLVSFLPLYVKEKLGVSPGNVVALDIAVMIGGALSGLFLGKLTDKVGSRPILMIVSAVALFLPVGWLLMPRNISYAIFLCIGLYLLYGAIANGLALASGRLLFNSVIPVEQNTAYTAIYYAWVGLTGGIATLLTGSLLSAFGKWQHNIGSFTVDGQRIIFVFAILLLSAGWWQYSRVKPDDIYSTRDVLKSIFQVVK